MLHPESLENEGAADPPTVPSYSEERRGGRTFPVVGIGASAGGLEAASSLLAGLPQSPGMAFVLVQHLDPKHESKLCDLLAKVTRLHVLEASHGLALRPDHVYVIPPNTSLTLEQGILQLTPRDEVRGLHLPIDRFFKSLAEDRQAGAIGVILSGTGSDGTLGVEEIKAAGGITFAQDEASAKFPSMPLSAIGSGCVDFVLPPEEIARELARIGRHPYVAPPRRPGTARRPATKSKSCFGESWPSCVPPSASISATTAIRRSGGGSCAAWSCTPGETWRNTPGCSNGTAPRS